VTRSLAQFALDCGGRLHGADRSFGAVTTDSRRLAPGELFVALRGPRFDGHEFVAGALAAGAAGAVVERTLPPALPQIVVADTQAALTRAAASLRARCSLPVVGVAGSNGKTTCKEMIAGILGQAGLTLATRGNLNNHIGVPLTLLRLGAGERFAVIEIGANRPGEVAELARLAAPGVGIVTNAGAEHLEGFGSIEGVARAEGELFEALAPSGTAIINADDEFAGLWRGMTRARVVSFGLDLAADFHAEAIESTVDGAGFLTRFALISPLGRTDIELRLAGMHNVTNALGAAAAASAAGASLADVVAGLAAMRPVSGRLQFRTARGGAWIIDDSYNANPSSMRAGIDVLAGLAGRRWMVLGAMAEMGEHGESAHVEIGRYAREHGVERLFATGTLGAIAVEAFGNGARWFPDAETLAQTLDGELTPDVRLLVKGSRVNRLERVVAALVDSDAAAGSAAAAGAAPARQGA
jgi:UDP-N-acetylmuramoyl-tripeptide--D-alanyl-D-alanine ligase